MQAACGLQDPLRCGLLASPALLAASVPSLHLALQAGF
jgi:hypothetical protein